MEIKGASIAEAFVTRALLNPSDVAAADDLSGVLTYERLLVGVLTTARRFTRLHSRQCRRDVAGFRGL